MTPTQEKLRKQYPTYQKFKTDVNPGNLLVTFANINTIQESIQKKRVTLEDIQVTYSDQVDGEAGIYYIRDWIRALQRFLNIKEGLPEEMAVGYMIYKKYKHLYIADLKLIYEKISLAEYGKYAQFYNALETQKILYSFSMYNYERHCLLNKEADKIAIKYDALKKQYEDEFKNKIFAGVVADGFEDGKKFEEYNRRVDLELPKMIMDKMKELDEADKNAPQK
ncbi:hypothetical protein [Dysgonomonas macrotermitis]|uniref:Uncharacterized protein n=1 Tax=Dysgonomonas macrotermitis TaxID=1346286 RepID=A0A1M4UM23_9BACT|nr:hypothetical protein [Dysgonomonas macrotermitis]SHE57734.1 hypothetical protein SAMN05444362_101643 [Dysgonomonas macrotermitis]